MSRNTPSKTEIAERLLTRPEGATMDEILAATGGSFQYSAKRRLQARGYTVRTRKEGRQTRYWAERPAVTTHEATITSKGQITVPKTVRKQMGLRDGQKLVFSLESSDRAVISPAGRSVSRLQGVLGKPERKLTLYDIDAVIRRKGAGGK